MLNKNCPAFLKTDPGTTCLLLYLEQQILTRHCHKGESYAKIAGSFSLTTQQVRKIHDRACERLQDAMVRLLLDLRQQGYGENIEGMLAELQGSDLNGAHNSSKLRLVWQAA